MEVDLPDERPEALATVPASCAAGIPLSGDTTTPAPRESSPATALALFVGPFAAAILSFTAMNAVHAFGPVADNARGRLDPDCVVASAVFSEIAAPRRLSRPN